MFVRPFESLNGHRLKELHPILVMRNREENLRCYAPMFLADPNKTRPFCSGNVGVFFKNTEKKYFQNINLAGAEINL